jgi:hypothetical protein
VVACVGHAAVAGVHGDPPLHVDHRGLPVGRGLVVAQDLGERLAGRGAAREQVEDPRAVGRLGDRLRRHGADARARVRHDRADAEPVRLHGDAELAVDGSNATSE